MQQRFVALLHAQLADVVGAAVVGLLLGRRLRHALAVALVDAAHMPDHVGGRSPQRVVANLAHLDRHPGQPEQLRRQHRHFFGRQAAAQRQRGKAMRLGAQALKAAQLAGRDR